ncbi:MAG: BMP family ABC transporter substrate-binding protein [Proteobacteria bacterium]|nr:BMP family ABC transporter substrate-binding protein [Pseudomonadota bacterium]
MRSQSFATKVLATAFLSLGVLTSKAVCADFQVGLLLDKAGKDDASFNASAFRGLGRAEKELGIKSKTVEAKDAAAAEGLLRSLAAKKFDLLVAIGFSQATAVRNVATAMPTTKFVLVDSEVKLPNVTSVMFAEHEGSFLMGAIAAMKSKSANVGFIGGMEVPLIRRFGMGFEAGAKYVNPAVKVQAAYIGVTGDAFNNPPKARELALLQNSQGADVIFHAAGASGKGLFDAAEEKKFFAIGVDSNQNGVKPGRVLTSMLKSVDLAVFEAIKQAKEGKLKGGETVNHGIANGGVDMAMDANNKDIFTSDMIKKAEDIKAGIKSGKIKVPDYYTVKK